MQKVVIADVSQQTLAEGIEEVFAAFGGVKKIIPPEGTVFIKPNGIHFSPQTHTDPRVLEALLAFLRDHGYARLAVMENCTNGNFTRLVFKITGYAELCRRYGAEAVYLDEGPTVGVTLRGEEEPVQIPRRLYDDLIAQREGHFYLSLPKLKTHCMTTVTLGVKNQQAFPVHAERMARHTHSTLHRRLAALYDLIRPDFCLIEGINAVIHGHFPATALLEECLVPMNLLIGGRDTLAVDVVGARVLGYGVAEVEHLRLAGEWGLGESDLNHIEVMGVPLSRFTERYPSTLLRRFHPDVRIVEGKVQACVEGCKGNSECILEMLTNDYHGRGGWTLIFGQGIDKGELEDLEGDFLVVGPCAVREVADWLKAKYPRRKVYTVDEHNDLMLNTTYQARLMGITPVMMVPMNPVLSALTLAQARVRGLTARVPPLLG